MSYEKFPTVKELYKELKGNKLQKAYCFIGEEEGEKEKAINLLIDKIFINTKEREYSTGRYHAEMGEFNDAADFCLSETLFSNSRFCIILNIEQINPDKNTASLLNEILTGSSSSLCVVFTSSENRLPPILNNQLRDYIKIIHFWKPFEKDLHSYIQQQSSGKSLSIDFKGREVIISLMGRNYRRIDDALEKLFNYAQGTEIDESMIRVLLREESDISITEFTDSLLQKNMGAFAYLAKLLEENLPELVILGSITRQYEMLEKYYQFRNSGSAIDDAMEKAGVLPRNRTGFLGLAEKNPFSAIQKIFALLTRTDSALKNQRYSKNPISNPLYDLTGEIIFMKPED